MNSQDESSKLQKRDMTFPLILTGLCSSYICICICMCAAILSISWYSENEVSAPCPPVPAGWQTIMNNDFDSNRYIWPIGENSDAYEDTDLQIVDGLLRLDVKAHQGVYDYQFPKLNNREQKDFYISTQARKVSGPPDAEYGLIFRVRADQHLFFTIQDSGIVKVHTRDTNGEWQDLFFSGRAENINVDESTQLSIFVEGSNYIFCVNQYVVGEVNNSDYSSGKFGIAVELENANDKAVFEYDDFIVYAPAK